jgi:hypothetical protein
MSISRAKGSGNFPESRSAQSEFETFISDLPPLLRRAIACYLAAWYHVRGAVLCQKNNKPTIGFVTEGGLGSFDLFLATRSPHTPAQLCSNNKDRRRILSPDSFRYLYHSAAGEKVNR